MGKSPQFALPAGALDVTILKIEPALGPKQACPEANPRGIGRLSGKDRLPPVGDPVAS